MSRSSDPFDLSGGHAALDFVNTLDERPSDAPIETLTSYDAFVKFAELAGLVEALVAKVLRSRPMPNGAQVARRARRLREHFFAVLSAHHTGTAADPNALHAISVEVRRRSCRAAARSRCSACRAGPA